MFHFLVKVNISALTWAIIRLHISTDIFCTLTTFASIRMFCYIYILVYMRTPDDSHEKTETYGVPKNTTNIIIFNGNT